jgi:trans-aconitate 2-methyltransferase
MPGSVADFYENFANELTSDFHSYNERQDLAIQLCRRFIPAGARVLELGCGAGIITRALSERASEVLAVDISSNNLKLAAAYSGAANVKFKLIDVVADRTKLEAEGTFDCILLADVIEHIPAEEHRGLFETFERILRPTGKVILTYPTPEYQSHLIAHEPSALQVIDQIIELRDLLASTTLRPVYFSYRDVWGRNQYAHLVLQRDIPYDSSRPRTVFGYVQHRIKKYWWRLKNRGFYRRMPELNRPPKEGAD